jgi:hypothetical protein
MPWSYWIVPLIPMARGCWVVAIATSTLLGATISYPIRYLVQQWRRLVGAVNVRSFWQAPEVREEVISCNNINIIIRGCPNSGHLKVNPKGFSFKVSLKFGALVVIFSD